jgi:hypothetical protein
MERKKRDLGERCSCVAQDTLIGRMTRDEIGIICEYAFDDVIRDILAQLIDDMNEKCRASESTSVDLYMPTHQFIPGNQIAVWIQLPRSGLHFKGYRDGRCLLDHRFMTADQLDYILARADLYSQRGLHPQDVDMIDDLWDVIHMYATSSSNIIHEYNITPVSGSNPMEYKISELREMYMHHMYEILDGKMYLRELSIICDYVFADIARDTLTRIIADMNGRGPSDQVVAWIRLPKMNRFITACFGNVCLVADTFMTADQIAHHLTRSDKQQQVADNLIDDIWYVIEEYIIKGPDIVNVCSVRNESDEI